MDILPVLFPRDGGAELGGGADGVQGRVRRAHEREAEEGEAGGDAQAGGEGEVLNPGVEV